MKKHLIKFKFLLVLCTGLLALGAKTTLGYDCNSDCGAQAAFRYRCPTFGNPGRMCDGRNPAKFAACETDKEVSCQLWENIENSVHDRLKRVLESRYNARTWAATAGNPRGRQLHVGMYRGGSRRLRSGGS